MVVVVVVEVVGKVVVVVVDLLQWMWHLPGHVATNWAENMLHGCRQDTQTCLSKWIEGGRHRREENRQSNRSNHLKTSRAV